MSGSKSVIRLLFSVMLVSALAIVGLLSVNASAADFLYPGGRQLHFDSSYVNDSWTNSSGAYMPLTPSKDSGNSKAQGYVLPNQKGSRYAPSGGGAVGWEALGLSKGVAMSAASNTTDNQTRKQAIYNFLYTKNTADSGDDLAWEQMGSSLIVHQLLEGKPPKTGRGEAAKKISKSSPMWADLKARLVDNDDVTVWLNDNYKIFEYNGKKSVDAYGNTIYLSNIVNTAAVQQNGYSWPTKYDAIHVTYGNYDSSPEMTYVWEFRQKSTGDLLYALVLDCANPIGGMPGLPTIKEQYSLTPTLTAPANGTVVKRGDSVAASGGVANAGDAAGSKEWYISRYKEGAAGGTKTGACTQLPDGECASREFTHDFTKEKTPGANTSGSMAAFPIPKDAKADDKYCFVVSVSQPTQSGTPAWRHSATSCVTVAPPEYELEPKATIDDRVDGGSIEPGTAITVTNIVTNKTSDNEKSRPTLWRLTRYEYTPGAGLTGTDKKGGTKDSDPCGSFKPAGRSSCETKQELTTKVFDPNTPTPFNPKYSETLPDDKLVGTKICFVASVKPVSYSSDQWRHSDMWCVVISKSPKVQVWGGDVRTGKEIRTGITSVASLGKTYGSWGEYAALSKGRNQSFGTGSGLASGGGAAQSGWSRLTFANVTNGRGTGAACSFQFGCFEQLSLGSMSLVGQFPLQKREVDVALGSLDGTYDTDKSITLSGATVGQGKSIIIRTTGVVTITGNIAYNDGPYTSVRDIPQVVVQASKINIEGNVTNIDAWLFAGELNTCSRDGGAAILPGDAKLTATKCSQKLRINGPVVADKVYLLRTAGSGVAENERGEPGEIFNLRADAYLWGYGYGSRTGRVQTVHVKELSPRF